MNNKILRTIVLIIIGASFIGVFFVTSIMDLLNTKDVQSIQLDAAGELLVVEHSINGIIPTSKDYYYIGVAEQTGSIYTIHANKKWLSENFDANGMANGDGVSIKGLLKRASDFEVENEIANRVSPAAKDSGLTLAFEPGKVIELNYVTDAIKKLIAGCFALILGIMFFIYKKKEATFPKWLVYIMLILFVVTTLLIVSVIL